MAGMESIPKKIPGLALCYLCIHILQWKDSPPPLYTVVYITNQMIASPGPTYHAKSRWSGSRGGNNLPAYFQFPAPKTKFVNPHLKVHMTIFNWSTKKSTWCLWRMLREKGIYMSTPSLPEMGTCKQAVLKPYPWLLPGVGFAAANEHLHIVRCHRPWRCIQELWKQKAKAREGTSITSATYA
jgi:hypothetical protein